MNQYISEVIERSGATHPIAVTPFFAGLGGIATGAIAANFEANRETSQQIDVVNQEIKVIEGLISPSIEPDLLIEPPVEHPAVDSFLDAAIEQRTEQIALIRDRRESMEVAKESTAFVPTAIGSTLLILAAIGVSRRGLKKEPKPYLG